MKIPLLALLFLAIKPWMDLIEAKDENKEPRNILTDVIGAVTDTVKEWLKPNDVGCEVIHTEKFDDTDYFWVCKHDPFGGCRAKKWPSSPIQWNSLCDYPVHTWTYGCQRGKCTRKCGSSTVCELGSKFRKFMEDWLTTNSKQPEQDFTCKTNEDCGKKAVWLYECKSDSACITP